MFVFLTRMRDVMYPTAVGMPAEVDEPIDQVLDRLESALAKHAPDTLASLQPGVTATQLKELEGKLGVQLSDDLRSLYMWRNGQVDDFEVDFIPIHHFASLERLVEERKEMVRQREEATGLQRVLGEAFIGHRFDWLPIFQDLAGDGYYYDPTRSHAEGAVFYNFNETGEFVFFPSLKNLLAGFVECYEMGVYSIDSDGRLVADYGRSREVWTKYGTPN